MDLSLSGIAVMLGLLDWSSNSHSFPTPSYFYFSFYFPFWKIFSISSFTSLWTFFYFYDSIFLIFKSSFLFSKISFVITFYLCSMVATDFLSERCSERFLKILIIALKVFFSLHSFCWLQVVLFCWIFSFFILQVFLGYVVTFTCLLTVRRRTLNSWWEFLSTCTGSVALSLTRVRWQVSLVGEPLMSLYLSLSSW